MTGNHQQSIVSRFLSCLIPVVKRNPHTSRAIEFILNNPLYKGVLILGSGTAVAQLIGLVTMPIITRLYLPSEMGILAVYSSVLAIFGVGATLRYEFAYALPKENEDTINLFGLCLILLCITTSAFALILFFGRDLLVNALDLGVIEQYIWFLLIGFFGMGLYTMLNYWAVRQRDYKRITYTKINQGAGGSVCKILLGILSLGPVGLIIGHIVSQIAGITTLARAMWRKERNNLKAISWSRMKSVAKTYRSFPAFNFPASIVNTMSLELPSLMLLALYDPAVVGFYALANMLVVLPGRFVSGSMGQAYLGEASKMVRERSQELRSLYVRTLKHLLVIAIPLIGIPALCAPFVVPFIFGGSWAEAGWYCWPLALAAIMGFVVSPTSFLSLYGYNRWQLIWDIGRVILALFGFYVSYALGFPVLITLLVYSIIRVSMNYILIILNIKAMSNILNRTLVDN
ncbi:lipopolysaccharide biosynthesis protein [Methanoculleus sp. Afa-1]|uniref:Lipopolysaccharide biosynthesis protein n=1 Tax=Methanoculleus formosensis TaxID=2590886 RepID=A0A9E5DG17_9EURY|nr:oligosaccharide flippase family protein [Methanoculleus sp. Afa-1]MCT8337796.1 lipopolysaccharide biosynthesis protein [Methanoculleus sp. Afa-1]